MLKNSNDFIVLGYKIALESVIFAGDVTGFVQTPGFTEAVSAAVA
jgi:hypothetical protein